MIYLGVSKGDEKLCLFPQASHLLLSHNLELPVPKL